MATILLGVLWFNDPQGNYDPLITVISTITAFIGTPTLIDLLQQPHLANNQREVEIKHVRLHYAVNNKALIANDGETINVTKGDTLLLKHLEIDFFAKPGSEGNIQAEATMRKPEIIVKDGYDYRDNRFTKHSPPIDIFSSGALYFKSGSSWVMKEGWDKLVIALVEYFSRHTKGHKTIKWVRFRISNR